jgi:hypothetical protein
MAKTPTDRLFHFWCVVREAEDMPGSWTAQCLDVDVITVGKSVKSALDMALEATCMVVVDDLLHRREPTDRKAPKAYWDDLYRILKHAKPISPTKFAKVRRGVIVTDLNIVTWPIVLRRPTAARPSPTPRPGVRRPAKPPATHVRAAFIASPA